MTEGQQNLINAITEAIAVVINWLSTIAKASWNYLGDILDTIAIVGIIIFLITCLIKAINKWLHN